MSTRGLASGIPPLPEYSQVCADCQGAKQTRERAPRESQHRSSHVLGIIHSDICGAPSLASYSGYSYFITFIDDYSRKCWVFFLRHKSEALAKFKIFQALVETITGTRIQQLRTDRGGEYISSDFDTYCETHGIHRQLTQAYTPHQNGVAERKNRTLCERMRSMMLQSNAPSGLWAEALNTANYITNRVPTRANFHTTPHEVFSGQRPDLSHLKIFGCLAHVRVNTPGLTKLDSRSIPCIFVRYDINSKAYRCFCPSTHKMHISKDVRFDETSYPFLSLSSNSSFFPSPVSSPTTPLSFDKTIDASSDIVSPEEGSPVTPTISEPPPSSPFTTASATAGSTSASPSALFDHVYQRRPRVDSPLAHAPSVRPV